jgi:tetratricopeptide (TPR) repeat protein
VTSTIQTGLPAATAGDLAVRNHESFLDRCWYVWRRWPDRRGTAEQIVDEEHRRTQFLGDTSALDRLATLSSELRERQPSCPVTHLIAAQVASLVHQFAEARSHLTEAAACGAPEADSSRIRLAIEQALGENWPAVLAARQEIAEATGALQDLVPLGALLADIGEYEEADRTYIRAIREYRDLSPFTLAWVCFQIGVLWGETIPEPDRCRAALWYQQAIEYLPAYTRARVHLAEIHLDGDEPDAAEALLLPVVNSSDPEIRWRLAQAMVAQGRADEGELQSKAAGAAFEALLARYELAFADHAAEFYLSSGADIGRAYGLARINLANRPTLRAFELAHRAAKAACDERFISDLLVRAQAQRGDTKAFAYSPLAKGISSRSTSCNPGAFS